MDSWLLLLANQSKQQTIINYFFSFAAPNVLCPSVPGTSGGPSNRLGSESWSAHFDVRLGRFPGELYDVFGREMVEYGAVGTV
ncbi:unnamed protein product [Caenorhabditis brenneri]